MPFICIYYQPPETFPLHQQSTVNVLGRPSSNLQLRKVTPCYALIPRTPGSKRQKRKSFRGQWKSFLGIRQGKEEFGCQNPIQNFCSFVACTVHNRMRNKKYQTLFTVQCSKILLRIKYNQSHEYRYSSDCFYIYMYMCVYIYIHIHTHTYVCIYITNAENNQGIFVDNTCLKTVGS